MKRPKRPQLTQANPTGRLDVLVYRILERTALEDPIFAAAWRMGFGESVEEMCSKLLPARNIFEGVSC